MTPEQQTMKAAGFTYDTTGSGLPRWTHKPTSTTAVRQPYMTDEQWAEHRANKILAAHVVKEWE